MIATAIAVFIGNALASMRRIATARGAQDHAPMTYPDAYLPRHRQRRSKHAARAVERVVIDDWLMWRK